MADTPHARLTPADAIAAASRFRQFSSQLYCAAAEEGVCMLPNGTRLKAGQCFWVTSASQRPLVDTEVVRQEVDKGVAWRRIPSDRWDPLHWPDAAATGYRYFGREEAAHCIRHKHILVAGDSTARDTFYELTAVAGHTIIAGMRNDSARYWTGFEPATPTSSGGRDIHGLCLGNHDKQQTCFRDEIYPEAHGADTRLSFQFLTRSNSTWETDMATGRISERGPDAVFVACPFYEWFKPDSYNYSLSKAERARVVGSKQVGTRNLAAIGESCMDYMDRVITRRFGLKTRLFVLSPPPLPGWTRDVGGQEVEQRLFKSINKGLGIRCQKLGEDGDERYEMFSQHGITPIDRYAIVGIRRRDAIHPFFNAQFAVVQLMLNHLCPMGGTTTPFSR